MSVPPPPESPAGPVDPYEPPPQTGMFPPPPGPPPRPKRRLMWLAVLIPVLLLAGGVFAAGKWLVDEVRASPNLAAVGDCLALPPHFDDISPEKVDCADPSANVRVAVRLDSVRAWCPIGEYDSLYFDGQDGFSLCLMLNVQKGDCVDSIYDNTRFQQVLSCDDPLAEVEVMDVVEGDSNLETACAEGDGGLTYSEPPTSICVRFFE